MQSRLSSYPLITSGEIRSRRFALNFPSSSVLPVAMSVTGARMVPARVVRKRKKPDYYEQQKRQRSSPRQIDPVGVRTTITARRLRYDDAPGVAGPVSFFTAAARHLHSITFGRGTRHRSKYKKPVHVHTHTISGMPLGGVDSPCP